MCYNTPYLNYSILSLSISLPLSYTFTYVSTYIHICVYTYTYIYTYIYIYTHVYHIILEADAISYRAPPLQRGVGGAGREARQGPPHL